MAKRKDAPARKMKSQQDAALIKQQKATTMKKILPLSALTLAMTLGAFSGAAQAAAGDSSVAVNYAQSHFNHTHGDDAKGAQIQYRYETDDEWGVMGAVTYTGATFDDSASHGVGRGHGDHHYFSLKAGPTYRINDWASVYGDIGYGYARSKYNTPVRHTTSSDSMFIYGAGLQFNPYQDWVIDAGYEYGTAGDIQVGTWNLGVGYRF